MPHEVRVELARRAMERAARCAVTDLGRGLTVLACVASSAVYIGMIGMLDGLLHPDFGCAGGTITPEYFVATWYGQPSIFVACGLLVALLTLGAHRLLSDRLKGLETELAHAPAEILDWVRIRSGSGPVSAFELARKERRQQRFPALRLRRRAEDGPVSSRRPVPGVLYELPLLWALLAALAGLWALYPDPDQEGVDVNVPVTAQPTQLDRSVRHLMLAVKADGQVFAGLDWIPREHLDRRLQELHAQAPDRPVRLKADRFLPYREVLDVLRAARSAGFTRLGFVTAPGQTDAGRQDRP